VAKFTGRGSVMQQILGVYMVTGVVCALYAIWVDVCDRDFDAETFVFGFGLFVVIFLFFGIFIVWLWPLWILHRVICRDDKGK
jgi:hypothetical protein